MVVMPRGHATRVNDVPLLASFPLGNDKQRRCDGHLATLAYSLLVANLESHCASAQVVSCRHLPPSGGLRRVC